MLLRASRVSSLGRGVLEDEIYFGNGRVFSPSFAETLNKVNNCTQFCPVKMQYALEPVG